MARQSLAGLDLTIYTVALQACEARLLRLILPRFSPAATPGHARSIAELYSPTASPALASMQGDVPFHMCIAGLLSATCVVPMLKVLAPRFYSKRRTPVLLAIRVAMAGCAAVSRLAAATLHDSCAAGLAGTM